MELFFLGTGATQGIPAAYCRCADCSGVRKRGGVEIKTRSSMRVGKHHQIDINAEYYTQMINCKTDMYDIEHILITHSHEDHLSFCGLTDKQMSTEPNGKPLEVYMSKPAYSLIEKLLSQIDSEKSFMKWMKKKMNIVQLSYFKEYQAGNMSFETVKGNHNGFGENEFSINYLITTPEGKKMLYACDTGYYKEDTWEYLQDRYVDLLVLDCTFAGRKDRGEFPGEHLDLLSFIKTLERMADMGFINQKTEIYATHFNPHQGLTHYEIDDYLRKSSYRAVAAYDGLRMEL